MSKRNPHSAQNAEAYRRDGLVFGELIASAKAKKPCPTNVELSEKLGLNETGISRAIQRLHKRGRIAIDKGLGQNVRIITICATGERTRPTASHSSVPIRVRVRNRDHENMLAKMARVASAENRENASEVERHTRQLEGYRFEDHPNFRPTGKTPKFVPHRTSTHSYGVSEYAK